MDKITKNEKRWVKFSAMFAVFIVEVAILCLVLAAASYTIEPFKVTIIWRPGY